MKVPPAGLHLGPESDEAEATLIRRMASGDRAALGELYDRLSRPLFATAQRILGDQKEAEDVLQEVFLSLWQRADDFVAERGSAFSWAVTLTRNRAIDRLRLRRRRGELLAGAAPSDLGYDRDGGRDSGTDLFSKEKAAAVRAAVDTLPAEQKAALELAFFGGLTQQEIAEQLQAPLGTIKARIRRGLLKLRDSLARRL